MFGGRLILLYEKQCRSLKMHLCVRWNIATVFLLLHIDQYRFVCGTRPRASPLVEETYGWESSPQGDHLEHLGSHYFINPEREHHWRAACSIRKGLWAPSGKPFMAPGCVVGLNTISMHTVLQARGQTLQTHSCCIRAWRANRGSLLLQEARDIKKGGLQGCSSNCSLSLDFIFQGGWCLEGVFEPPPFPPILQLMWWELVLAQVDGCTVEMRHQLSNMWCFGGRGTIEEVPGASAKALGGDLATMLPFIHPFIRPSIHLSVYVSMHPPTQMSPVSYSSSNGAPHFVFWGLKDRWVSLFKVT